MSERRSKPEKQRGNDGTEGRPTVQPRWNASSMRHSYANVCSVTSTREEVFLLFGMNRPWQDNQERVTIDLIDRIILNPHTAKRFSVVLKRVIQEYEARFGELRFDERAPEPSGTGS